MIKNVSIAIFLILCSGLYAQKSDSTDVLRSTPHTVTILNIRYNPGLAYLNKLKPPQNTKQLTLQKAEAAQNYPGQQNPNFVEVYKGPTILKEFKLSDDFSEEINIPFDTVFSLFNRFRRADIYSPVNANLGNYGLPFYQLNFFDRITDPDKFLYDYYYPLMILPEKATFINTQVPFTELIWTFATPRATSEQTFRVRHSQNINRYLNFGVNYDIIYDLGQYNYQRAENKAFTFHSSYTGPKYKMYLSAGLNNITSFENGGITDKSEIDIEKNRDTRDIPVKLGGLNNAVSKLKNRNLLLVQRYTITAGSGKKAGIQPEKLYGFSGISGTLSHIMTVETNKRTYSDSYPESGFYDSIYINSKSTFDSLYFRIVKNTVRIDLASDKESKFRIGGGAGIRNDLMAYSQIIPTHDTTVADTSLWYKRNNVFVANFYNNLGDKLKWSATGEYYMGGYRLRDFKLNGVIEKSFDWKKGSASWLITAALTKSKPSFWYQHWGSNHFEWNNEFDKELRMDLGTSFIYPGRKAEIKLNYAVIDNYTYFDTLALPAQYAEGLSIAALTVKKEMRAWKFHLASDLIIQKSSNPEVLDLPLVTVRSAGFFEHLFRFKSTGGKLNLQFGLDVTYHTLYNSYSYMPATGRFFNQSDTTTGKYPFVDVFLNLKLKRTRIFIMFDHVNYGIMGENTAKNYDMIRNYPLNIRMFRYGVAWTFYD